VFIKSSFSCLGSSCIHVLFDSYLEVMINPRLTTLAPYVSIPHLVLTQNAMYPLVVVLIEFLIERDIKQFFLNVDETNPKPNIQIKSPEVQIKANVAEKRVTR